MLKKKLTDDLIIAIKKKDKESVNTLRLMIAAIKDKEIALRSENNNKEISEEIIFNILKNMVKQRNESIDLYKKGNRQELVDKEKKEIDIIQRFLPRQLDEAVLKKICKEIIEKLNVNIIGICSLAHRGDFIDFGYNYHTLSKIEIDTWEEDKIPDWLKNIPITKPGSRYIR